MANSARLSSICPEHGTTNPDRAMGDFAFEAAVRAQAPERNDRAFCVSRDRNQPDREQPNGLELLSLRKSPQELGL
jgi:hypothetical protein